jgi:hypothetical protein
MDAVSGQPPEGASQQQQQARRDSSTETATTPRSLAPLSDLEKQETIQNQSANDANMDTSGTSVVAWEDDPHNPWNWPTGKKVLQVVMLASSGFLASLGTSIMSPARTALMAEFNVSGTVALLPLTLYVVALGFGPVVGGPLSETWGRYPVYCGTLPLGALFALGAGFTHSFGALCFLRFMSGFCWAPVLATAAGSLSDVFPPSTRGPASALFILMPFLGPGLG